MNNIALVHIEVHNPPVVDDRITKGFNGHALDRNHDDISVDYEGSTLRDD